MIYIDYRYSRWQNILWFNQANSATLILSGQGSPSLLIDLEVLTDALHLVIFYTFVNSVLLFFVKSCNVCVFCKIIFSNKLDLFQATCYITNLLRKSIFKNIGQKAKCNNCSDLLNIGGGGGVKPRAYPYFKAL